MHFTFDRMPSVAPMQERGR